MLLTPTEREAASPKISIGNYKTVRLRINAPEGSYAAYCAVLKSADGRFQRGFTSLPARGPPEPAWSKWNFRPRSFRPGIIRSMFSA